MSAPSASSSPLLEGNGAGLVRAIALASRVQSGLERLYRLDRQADVDDFVTCARAEDGEREALFVRQAEDGALELRVRLPELVDAAGEDLDKICQIIEGVSHFVYVAERAAREREATQLELEVQAEVDKYVVLASSQPAFDEARSRLLRTHLYERVDYLHRDETEEGERYRIANDCARRFVTRIEREFVARARYSELQRELRRFFHLGQGEKLRAA